MRKLRTRQHFIEDLGFNYIEKQLLLARCTLRRHHIDYGYDASIVTYKNTGEIENGEISLQLKSTDNIQSLKDKEVYTFDLSKRDLELWLDNILPVILLLYDATSDRAYFIELGKYFNENKLSLNKINKFIRVYLPKNNLFTREVVKEMRNQKNKIYGNFKSL